MKRTLAIIAIAITALMLVCGVYCARAPITREMISISGYYHWCRGQGSLDSEVYAAFTRDMRFQATLIGRPIQAIQPLFPRMTTGVEYPADSYRSINRPTEWPAGHPITCYWLNGEDNENHGHQFGYCVLVRDGVIVRFKWIKG